ncbi:MAG: YihA family ribosome biogenesis GTP-binding protein [Lachnospiraceae bacterium]|nr:YihA family ribosome biogenesis GTP-binding protein [Lachnospiraceae bacterium]
MHVSNVTLETVCGITSTLPENDKLEIAFAGKSNVGKSSLINALMNRKSVARTSSQPGKTQTINFYNIDEKLYFVDLPGYGYAKVSLEIRAKWGKLIEKYLINSKKLRIIFLLVDIRHEPSQNDVDMYNWILEYGFNPIIIATKLDKIKRSQIQKNVSIIRKKLKAIENTPIIPFSSLTKQGRDDIWEFIEDYMEYEASIEEAEVTDDEEKNAY